MSESPQSEVKMSNPQPERRASARYPCKCEIYCQISQGAFSQLHGGYTVNVSQGGCLLRLTRRVEVGTLLHLTSENGLGQIDVYSAQVQHIQQTEQGWLHGCSWLAPLSKDEVSYLIAAFVEEAEQTSPTDREEQTL